MQQAKARVDVARESRNWSMMVTSFMACPPGGFIEAGWNRRQLGQLYSSGPVAGEETPPEGLAAARQASSPTRSAAHCARSLEPHGVGGQGVGFRRLLAASGQARPAGRKRIAWPPPSVVVVEIDGLRRAADGGGVLLRAGARTWHPCSARRRPAPAPRRSGVRWWASVERRRLTMLKSSVARLRAWFISICASFWSWLIWLLICSSVRTAVSVFCTKHEVRRVEHGDGRRRLGEHQRAGQHDGERSGKHTGLHGETSSG